MKRSCVILWPLFSGLLFLSGCGSNGNPPPSVRVSVLPASATVSINATQAFTATVTGASNKSVTWSVSGTGCSGAACGTISSAGIFTAPAAIPTPATVTVTATSQADTSKSGTATVTIVVNHDSLVNGTYAFQFSGFDGDGAMAAAGSFHADGIGNLTAGIEDINRFSAVNTAIAFTGTYSIGLDNRGTFTLTSSLGTTTFSLALDASGDARFIELDSSGTRGSGIFKLQDPTQFSTSAINQDYAFGFFGMVPFVASYRFAEVGQFHTDGAGTLSSGVLDVAVPASLTAGLSLAGTYSVPGGSTNGRGTAVFQSPIPGTGGIFNFAFYIVSADELFFVSTDLPVVTLPLVSGVAEAQSGGPFNNASLSGTFIFNQTGQTVIPSPSVTVGQFTTDGAGNLTGAYDQNDNGNISSNVAFAGNYTISSNGRGILNWSTTPPTFVVSIFYVADNNKGFLLVGPSFNPGSDAQSGSFEAQSGAPFSNGSLSGDFSFATITPVASSVIYLGGIATLNGVGALTGTQDASGPGGNASAQTLAGTYAVSGNGRGTVSLTLPAAGNLVFYAVSPGKLVAIDADSGNPQSAVVEYEK